MRPTLITIHNTYQVHTPDFIDKTFLQGTYKPNIRQSPTKKVPISKRNSRIIQIGHACQWDTFLTLTFSPEFYWPDLSKIQKQFRTFLKKLYYHLNEPLKYLAVLEYGTETGRIHYHMLTNIPFDSDIFYFRDHPFKKCCELWDFGFSDVSKVNNDNCNAVFYLAKYLSKGNAERTPIGKREVFSSRGLNKVVRVVTPYPNLYLDNFVEWKHTKSTIIYVKKRSIENVK